MNKIIKFNDNIKTLTKVSKFINKNNKKNINNINKKLNNDPYINEYLYSKSYYDDKIIDLEYEYSRHNKNLNKEEQDNLKNLINYEKYYYEKEKSDIIKIIKKYISTRVSLFSENNKYEINKNLIKNKIRINKEIEYNIKLMNIENKEKILNRIITKIKNLQDIEYSEKIKNDNIKL